MEKNKFVLIHHITTMIGVAESSILLKRQHKKKKITGVVLADTAFCII